jgi:hypothetical protein
MAIGQAVMPPVAEEEDRWRPQDRQFGGGACREKEEGPGGNRLRSLICGFSARLSGCSLSPPEDIDPTEAARGPGDHRCREPRDRPRLTAGGGRTERSSATRIIGRTVRRGGYMLHPRRPSVALGRGCRPGGVFASPFLPDWGNVHRRYSRPQGFETSDAAQSSGPNPAALRDSVRPTEVAGKSLRRPVRLSTFVVSGP